MLERSPPVPRCVRVVSEAGSEGMDWNRLNWSPLRWYGLKVERRVVFSATLVERWKGWAALGQPFVPAADPCP